MSFLIKRRTSEPPVVVKKVPEPVVEKRKRKVFHVEARASVLSSEAPQQNYRGFVNLGLLILFATHIRLVIENISKYGLLVRPDHIAMTYPKALPIMIVLVLAYNIFIIIALATERAVNSKSISEKTSFSIHFVNVFTLLAVPIYITETAEGHPIFGFVQLAFAIVLWMKLISYAHGNYEYRMALNAGTPIEEVVANNDNVVKYPDNLTWGNLYYFVFAPTLIYQLNYPRSSRVRKVWLAKRIGELVFYIGLMLFLVEQYVIPTVQNTMIPLKEMHLTKLAERLLKLAIPSLYIWLLSFYTLFHLWLNILAEVLRFGDRYFYGCWWNSTTMDEYWRIWNIPTHNWLLRHVMVPLISSGTRKHLAGLAVFAVSAFFHELIISVPVRTFRFWAFIGMMGNVPLIFITHNFFHGSQIGNLIFWFSFCFLGQPLCVLLYYNDYYQSNAIMAG